MQAARGILKSIIVKLIALVFRIWVDNSIIFLLNSNCSNLCLFCFSSLLLLYLQIRFNWWIDLSFSTHRTPNWNIVTLFEPYDVDLRRIIVHLHIFTLKAWLVIIETSKIRGFYSSLGALNALFFLSRESLTVFVDSWLNQLPVCSIDNLLEVFRGTFITLAHHLLLVLHNLALWASTVTLLFFYAFRRADSIELKYDGFLPIIRDLPGPHLHGTFIMRVPHWIHRKFDTCLKFFQLDFRLELFNYRPETEQAPQAKLGDGILVLFAISCTEFLIADRLCVHPA